MPGRLCCRDGARPIVALAPGTGVRPPTPAAAEDAAHDATLWSAPGRVEPTSEEIAARRREPGRLVEVRRRTKASASRRDRWWREVEPRHSAARRRARSPVDAARRGAMASPRRADPPRSEPRAKREAAEAQAGTRSRSRFRGGAAGRRERSSARPRLRGQGAGAPRHATRPGAPRLSKQREHAPVIEGSRRASTGRQGRRGHRPRRGAGRRGGDLSDKMLSARAASTARAAPHLRPGREPDTAAGARSPMYARRRRDALACAPS